MRLFDTLKKYFQEQPVEEYSADITESEIELETLVEPIEILEQVEEDKEAPQEIGQVVEDEVELQQLDAWQRMARQIRKDIEAVEGESHES